MLSISVSFLVVQNCVCIIKKYIYIKLYSHKTSIVNNDKLLIKMHGWIIERLIMVIRNVYRL